jgi:hypothetical protein
MPSPPIRGGWRRAPQSRHGTLCFSGRANSDPEIEPSPYLDHIEWVAGLSDVEVQQGASWLQSIVETTMNYRLVYLFAIRMPEVNGNNMCPNEV